MVVVNDNGDSNSNSNSNPNTFTKTICSICYEDLKPLVEDLQSISVCGHVFHELCLQQWFEYCPNVKKRSCPICKQTCTNANVGRLYFQSVGEQNESGLSQKPKGYDESPEELRREVERLEGKVGAMASSLEQQQKEVKEIKDQLLSCKDQLKVEAALKTEAINQMATSQQLLRMKSVELDKSTLERMRLQERNMALAKELAALKLVSDLDLEENEITKLASFGNDAGSKETIDVLRKSLVIRNKSYKELMTKCNVLGRGEARCLQKLEKANDKIKKLKSRVQELETTFEIKENESLRVLKDQDVKFKTGSHENKMKRSPCKPLSRKSTMDFNLPRFIMDDQDKQEKSHALLNDDENITSYTFVQGSDSNGITKGYPVPIKNACFDTQSPVEMLNHGDKDGVSCSGSMAKRRKSSHDSKPPTDLDDDDFICFGNTNPAQASVHIRNEIQSSTPASGTGEHCFSGGLLGPDGTNYHLGKWCKKAQGSNARSGDLIAVGADGRGGRIKVMRTLDQSSLDTRDTSSWAKKCKLVNKPNKLQSVGHLKIEHFFQKTGQ